MGGGGLCQGVCVTLDTSAVHAGGAVGNRISRPPDFNHHRQRLWCRVLPWCPPGDAGQRPGVHSPTHAPRTSSPAAALPVFPNTHTALPPKSAAPGSACMFLRKAFDDSPGLEQNAHHSRRTLWCENPAVSPSPLAVAWELVTALLPRKGCGPVQQARVVPFAGGVVEARPVGSGAVGQWGSGSGSGRVTEQHDRCCTHPR